MYGSGTARRGSAFTLTIVCGGDGGGDSQSPVVSF